MLSDVEGMDAGGYAAKGLTGREGRATARPSRSRSKYPFADFPLVLGNPATGVWPVDYMKKVSYEAFRNKPVGTGPYMVERWAHGEYIDLVKNPDYWDAENAGYVDSGPPAVHGRDDAVEGVPEGRHRHRVGARESRWRQSRIGAEGRTAPGRRTRGPRWPSSW